MVNTLKTAAITSMICALIVSAVLNYGYMTGRIQGSFAESEQAAFHESAFDVLAMQGRE